MDRIVAICLILCVSRWSVCSAMTESQLLSKLLSDYDKSALPSTSPTEVKIGVYFNKFGEMDEASEMKFSGNFYLRQNWKDPRLQFDPADLDGKTEFRLGPGSHSRIWKPDIFFRNGYEVNIVNAMSDHILLKLNSTGHLWFVVQMTSSFYCPMKLQRYPFDTQTCPIMFESFGHTMDELYFSWLNNPIELDSSIQLSTYTLQNTILYNCSQIYTSGAFPCLEARFVLKRDTGYFFLQIFMPTALLVIMSWFVLWLDCQEFFQRLGLTFLLIVCLILMHTTVGNQVATVQYLKALDIWMFVCLLFIFAVLLESIVVKVIFSRSYKTTEHVNLDDSSVKRVHDNKVIRRIDLVSRIAFPLVYLLFIIIYFSVYH